MDFYVAIMKYYRITYKDCDEPFSWSGKALSKDCAIRNFWAYWLEASPTAREDLEIFSVKCLS